MSLAARYERFLVPIIMDRWARALANVVAPDDRVLDAGCGTGIVGRHAAARAGARGRVTGLDLSPDMLGVARAACAAAGRRVDWVLADACRMPLQAATFDVVLCQFSLMFMADKAAALREMRRALKPGGTLRIVVFASGPFDQSLRRSLSRFVEPDESGFAIWACGDPHLMRSLVGNAGFDIISLEQQSSPSCYASVRQSLELMKDWNQQIAHLSDAAHAHIIRDLEAGLSDCISSTCFACPEPVLIITARAR